MNVFANFSEHEYYVTRAREMRAAFWRKAIASAVAAPAAAIMIVAEKIRRVFGNNWVAP